MRILRALQNDIRYQFRYGFYFVYALLTVLYILLLRLVPSAEVRGIVAAFVLLSDPAVLGYFFIGGIWMLEKDEDLHGYFTITPQGAAEYVLSKAVSLAVLSTLAAAAIAVGAGLAANVPLLVAVVFFASLLFTLVGLVLATFAKSVNAYLLCAVPPAAVLVAPAVFTALGHPHPVFELVPGTLALRLIGSALSGAYAGVAPRLLGLAAWCLLFFALAVRAVRREIHPKGGARHA